MTAAARLIRTVAPGETRRTLPAEMSAPSSSETPPAKASVTCSEGQRKDKECLDWGCIWIGINPCGRLTEHASEPIWSAKSQRSETLGASRSAPALSNVHARTTSGRKGGGSSHVPPQPPSPLKREMHRDVLRTQSPVLESSVSHSQSKFELGAAALSASPAACQPSIARVTTPEPAAPTGRR